MNSLSQSNIDGSRQSLRTGLLLLSLPQGQEGNVGDLDGLELDSGNITNGVSLATETGNKDLIVDLDKVKTAVVGDEGSDLLAVLQELHTDALTDGRVGLLGLDTTRENNRLVSSFTWKGWGGAVIMVKGNEGVSVWISHVSTIFPVESSA
jgi:hypothetical protein